MATPDPRRIIKGLYGYLCVDPTDVAGTVFPHGGTALGLMRDGEFRYGERQRLVGDEAYGKVFTEAFRVQESPIFVAVLREWDDDALGTVFPDTETGDTGRTVIRGRVGVNGLRGGQVLSESAVALYFSPRAIDQHPSILVYSAIPVLMDTESLRAGGSDAEVGVAIGFYGIPDGTGRLYQIAYRGDVEL